MNRLPLLLSLLALPACERRSAPPAPPPTASARPAPARLPSWKSEIAPFLVVRCASERRCHGESPTGFVDLDLRAPAAWAQLVGARAEERPGALRVKPGDPEASFLVDKLRGHLGPREGQRMPRTSAGEPGDPVEPDFLDNALLPWIRAGAPNN